MGNDFIKSNILAISGDQLLVSAKLKITCAMQSIHGYTLSLSIVYSNPIVRKVDALPSVSVELRTEYTFYAVSSSSMASMQSLQCSQGILTS